MVLLSRNDRLEVQWSRTEAVHTNVPLKHYGLLYWPNDGCIQVVIAHNIILLSHITQMAVI